MVKTALDETIKRLTEFESQGHPVLSLYLNLAPPGSPYNRAKRLGKQELEYIKALDLPRDFQEEARALVDETLRELQAPHFISGGRALVFFYAKNPRLFEVIKVPRIWRDRLVIDDHPRVRQLLALRDEISLTYVVTWEKRQARLFRVDLDQAYEVVDFFNPDLWRLSKFRTMEGKFVHGGRIAGLATHGYGEHNFNQWVRHETAHMLKTIADTLFDLYRKEHFDHLVIGSHEGEKMKLEDYLHPYLRDRLIGSFTTDLRTLTETEVYERTLEFLRQKEAREEHRVMEQIREKLGKGWAVVGVHDTLKALMFGQVHTLVVDPYWDQEGFRCPESGFLSDEPLECPEGKPPVRVHDLVDEAVEWALETRSQVEVVFEKDLLPEIQGLAALLRYPKIPA